MALPQDSLTDFDHLLTFAVQQEQAVNDDGDRRHEQAFQNFLHKNHPLQTAAIEDFLWFYNYWFVLGKCNAFVFGNEFTFAGWI